MFCWPNNNKFVGRTQGEIWSQGKLSMSENFPLLSDQFKQKTRFNKCNYSLISSLSLNFNISKPDIKLWKTNFLSRSYN
jgi:hypothetical protein